MAGNLRLAVAALALATALLLWSKWPRNLLVLLVGASCFYERGLARLVCAAAKKYLGYDLDVRWIALRLSFDPDTESELVIRHFVWANPKIDGLCAPYLLNVGRATLRFSLPSLIHAFEHGVRDNAVEVYSLMFEDVTMYFEKDDSGFLNLWSACGYEDDDADAAVVDKPPAPGQTTATAAAASASSRPPPPPPPKPRPRPPPPPPPKPTSQSSPRPLSSGTAAELEPTSERREGTVAATQKETPPPDTPPRSNRDRANGVGRRASGLSTSSREKSVKVRVAMDATRLVSRAVSRATSKTRAVIGNGASPSKAVAAAATGGVAAADLTSGPSASGDDDHATTEAKRAGCARATADPSGSPAAAAAEATEEDGHWRVPLQFLVREVVFRDIEVFAQAFLAGGTHIGDVRRTAPIVIAFERLRGADLAPIEHHPAASGAGRGGDGDGGGDDDRGDNDCGGSGGARPRAALGEMKHAAEAAAHAVEVAAYAAEAAAHSGLRWRSGASATTGAATDAGATARDGEQGHAAAPTRRGLYVNEVLSSSDNAARKECLPQQLCVTVVCDSTPTRRGSHSRHGVDRSISNRFRSRRVSSEHFWSSSFVVSSWRPPWRRKCAEIDSR